MAENNTVRFVYGIFLADLECFTCRTATVRHFESGDLISSKRTATAKPVLLGISTSKDDAKCMANTYLEEVGRVHGVDNVDSILLGETQLTE